MNIVVIESGFTYIGKIDVLEHEVLGKVCVLSDASNIRRWGTNKGLGQLALQGKQQDTVLDFVGTVSVPIGKILHIIELSESAKQSFNG